jgi:oligopeptide transport system substrate-binding protein
MIRTVLAISLSTLVFATACDTSSNADNATTLKVGNLAEPQSLDPIKAAGSWDGRIASAMFEGLMKLNAKGDPVPGMAENWTTSEDGRTWTFTLRDASWSDGVPVTAEDFLAAFIRLLTIEPAPTTVDLLFPIVNAKEVREGTAPVNSLGVRALDDKTLEFKLKHPVPYFLQLMALFTSSPLPRHAFDKYGEDWIKAENIVVNGAFKLARWKPGDFVHLVRNPDYWNNSTVCLNNVYLFPTTDFVAAERQIRTGDLDIQLGFSGPRLAEIKRVMPDTVQIAPMIRSDFLVFNHRKPLFGDVRVRRALSLAIDREFIANEVLSDGSTPAFGFVPPTTPGYPSTSRLRWKNELRNKRLAEARALLEEVGHGPSKPFTFRILFSSGGDGPRFAPVLQQNWRDIAPWVQPTIEGAETAVHIRNLRAGDFDVGWSIWGSLYADASEHLSTLESGASANFGGYSNQKFDATLERARRTTDPFKRVSHLLEAEQMLLDEDAIAPLFFASARNLVNPRVTGWENNAMNVHPIELLCTKEARK